jgi:predicted AAA+ superfamily ATPase
MKREITEKLIEWKQSAARKPLVLLGVRQCGKTWTLNDFGKANYENIVRIDFAETPAYSEIFELSLEPERILDQIRMRGNVIHPGKTLLIFDEIQECPSALSSLKYFNEKNSEYHIACAGSLLGVRLAKGGTFPVGNVDFMRLYPMNFSEFLIADGNRELADFMAGIDSIDNIPSLFAAPLVEKLKSYFAFSGMPESVRAWTEDRNAPKADDILSSILLAYDLDFVKHLSAADSQKVSRVWNSLPAHLAKENKKFIYKLVKDNAKAREYESSIQWLQDASMVYRVNRISEPGIPVSAYDDPSSFKLYACDAGLLRKLAGLDTDVLVSGNAFFTGFKGAFVENYILSALSPLCEVPLRYWSKNNPSYEVDFILQHRGRIIPIEVKSDENTKSRSLKEYKKRYGERADIAVRFSTKNLLFQDGILNIPLYLADHAMRLIDIATVG